MSGEGNALAYSLDARTSREHAVVKEQNRAENLSRPTDFDQIVSCGPPRDNIDVELAMRDSDRAPRGCLVIESSRIEEHPSYATGNIPPMDPYQREKEQYEQTLALGFTPSTRKRYKKVSEESRKGNQNSATDSFSLVIVCFQMDPTKRVGPDGKEYELGFCERVGHALWEFLGVVVKTVCSSLLIIIICAALLWMVLQMQDVMPATLPYSLHSPIVDSVKQRLQFGLLTYDPLLLK